MNCCLYHSNSCHGGKQEEKVIFSEIQHLSRILHSLTSAGPGYMTMTVLQLSYHGRRSVIPNTRKISGLLEAVAVLDGRVRSHAATARNDGEREESSFRNTVFAMMTLSLWRNRRLQIHYLTLIIHSVYPIKYRLFRCNK